MNKKRCLFFFPGILLLIAKTDVGCSSLLASDLDQMVWLPLSDIKQANPDWVPVFQLSLQLATSLLRVGKHNAVDGCITVAALFQEQLSTFLMAPRLSVQTPHLELMVTSASFIALLMKFRNKVTTAAGPDKYFLSQFFAATKKKILFFPDRNFPVIFLFSLPNIFQSFSFFPRQTISSLSLFFPDKQFPVFFSCSSSH